MDESGVVHTGNFLVQVSLDPQPPQIGTNELVVQVADSDANAITNAQVRAVVQFQDSDVMQNTDVIQTDDYSMDGPPRTIAIDMQEIAPGKYSGTFELTTTGQWVLAVDVEKNEFGHADLVFDMQTGKDSHKGLKLATTTPEGIAYYTCSMHTSVRAAGPGQCPICSMDLVPVTNEEVQTGTINVDSRRRQLIGLKTDVARQRELVSTIRAVGEVTYDQTRLSDVNLRFDAWVGELKADYVGKHVRQGEMLFSVYGPDLLAAQQEYLEVLKRRPGQSNNSLAEAARKRLSLWDMTAGQIRQLEKRGIPLDYVPIMAPRTGTVVEKMVVIGTANKAGTTLMRIADLSRVWVEADVYESELNLVKTGMQAVVSLPYMPGRTYAAKVDYVYPYLKGDTRTGRIRLVINNADGNLKPEMYAEVKLQVKLGQRLAIPEQAVLFAGDHRVVFVDLGEGRLKPTTITTGVRTQEYIEVLEGLRPGDKVVTSGNFLIAAESRLKSGTAQW
jgi:Cu(I)/Ag(I) efflux system membrane fusion protein